jgi:hypothetical protein
MKEVGMVPRGVSVPSKNAVGAIFLFFDGGTNAGSEQ